MSRISSCVSKLLLYFVSCIVKMTASIAEMSGFLEVAITYTFHSALCVKSSGSSAYRCGTCGHLGFIYVQTGTGVEILTQSGKGGEKNFFSDIFPASFQTVPLPLSWFETHPRWPPVTQYAIVGLTSEQSSYCHDYTCWKCTGKRNWISRKNDTGRKFLNSEEFMRLDWNT